MPAKNLCTPRCLLMALSAQRNHQMVKKLHRPLSSTHVSNKTDETQSTISSSHVGKFSTYEWWNENGPVKSLHAMNEVRIPFIRDGLVPCTSEERTIMPLKGKKILDVGCGAGILSEALAKIGAEVTGIDANKELVEVATHHSNANDKLSIKPSYCLSTIEEHSAHFANHYDGVVASEIIEHVNNKELFVKSCINVCKPGGRIFVTTPTRTRLTQVLGIWIAEYVLNAIPKGTHEYEMMVTPTELTFLLERNNCHVEMVYGMIYNPFTNRFGFIESQKLMFAMQAIKMT